MNVIIFWALKSEINFLFHTVISADCRTIYQTTFDANTSSLAYIPTPTPSIPRKKKEKNNLCHLHTADACLSARSAENYHKKNIFNLKIVEFMIYLGDKIRF